MRTPLPYDLVIVGGGINGVGIAQQAAERGLRVLLLEQNDLGEGTSSRSSQLIHGGLRYLEQRKFRLVHEALEEREKLLQIAPHLCRPLRFRIPLLDSPRPAWQIAAGLWLYDNLARRKRLPASQRVQWSKEGALNPTINTGYEYSDLWVDDARLVVSVALAAQAAGATIRSRTRFEHAEPCEQGWQVQINQQGVKQDLRCRVLVNACGPWADFFTNRLAAARVPKNSATLRLVKGSHLVLPNLGGDPHAYLLQNGDRRVVFVIPFNTRFVLLGTTEVDYFGDPAEVTVSIEEENYLLAVAARYFPNHWRAEQVCHRFAGVRPLLISNRTGDAASGLSREALIQLSFPVQHSPLLSISGGKLSGYRLLAERATQALEPLFPGMKSTPGLSPLPGGEFTSLASLEMEYSRQYPWLPQTTLQRWLARYGCRIPQLIGNARSFGELAPQYGEALVGAEVAYLYRAEWARTVDDVIWRRTKAGLELNTRQIEAVREQLSRLALTQPHAAPH